MTSGVLQGSVLDALLFVIYSSDLDENLEDTVRKFGNYTKLGGMEVKEFIRNYNVVLISQITGLSGIQFR